MTQEEKAKRYDEALKVIKDNLDALNEITETGAEVVNIQSIKNCFYRAFPEIKEIDDEKIRKALITFFNRFPYDSIKAAGTNAKEAIAWLEKQGEQKQDPCDNCKDVMLNCHNFPCTKKRAFKQGKSLLEVINEEKVDNANKVEPKDYSSIDPHFGKPVDKVKPKFKQGQWIVWKDKCYKVNYNGCGYELIDQNGLSTSLEYGTVDTSARLWDVTKDAKAGDVLVIQETDFTYESIFIFNKIENNHIIQYLHYFITDTDEEVCKVKSVGGFIGDVGDNVHPATKEQREQLKKAMTDAGYAFNFDKKELKKIEQKSVEWSEEDEKMLSDIIEFGAHDRLTPNDISWLNSLRNRVQPKPKLAWSEEDENLLKLSFENLTELKDRYGEEYGKVGDCISWLKSLKDRVGCEVNCTTTWKPSDAQIEAFEHFVRSIGESGYASPYDNNTKLLYSILSDLKKLKED